MVISMVFAAVSLVVERRESTVTLVTVRSLLDCTVESQAGSLYIYCFHRMKALVGFLWKDMIS